MRCTSQVDMTHPIYKFGFVSLLLPSINIFPSIINDEFFNRFLFLHNDYHNQITDNSVRKTNARLSNRCHYEVNHENNFH